MKVCECVTKACRKHTVSAFICNYMQVDSEEEAIIYKPPVKIIYGGSGSVNGRDVLIAKTANGKREIRFVCMTACMHELVS